MNNTLEIFKTLSFTDKTQLIVGILPYMLIPIWIIDRWRFRKATKLATKLSLLDVTTLKMTKHQYHKAMKEKRFLTRRYKRYMRKFDRNCKRHDRSEAQESFKYWMKRLPLFLLVFFIFMFQFAYNANFDDFSLVRWINIFANPLWGETFRGALTITIFYLILAFIAICVSTAVIIVVCKKIAKYKGYDHCLGDWFLDRNSALLQNYDSAMKKSAYYEWKMGGKDPDGYTKQRINVTENYTDWRGDFK